MNRLDDSTTFHIDILFSSMAVAIYEFRLVCHGLRTGFISLLLIIVFAT